MKYLFKMCVHSSKRNFEQSACCVLQIILLRVEFKLRRTITFPENLLQLLSFINVDGELVIKNLSLANYFPEDIASQVPDDNISLAPLCIIERRVSYLYLGQWQHLSLFLCPVLTPTKESIWLEGNVPPTRNPHCPTSTVVKTLAARHLKCFTLFINNGPTSGYHFQGYLIYFVYCLSIYCTL